MIVARGFGRGNGSTLVTGGYGLRSVAPVIPPSSAGAVRPMRRPMRFDLRRDEEELVAIVSAAMLILNAQ